MPIVLVRLQPRVLILTERKYQINITNTLSTHISAETLSTTASGKKNQNEGNGIRYVRKSPT